MRESTTPYGVCLSHYLTPAHSLYIVILACLDCAKQRQFSGLSVVPPFKDRFGDTSYWVNNNNNILQTVFRASSSCQDRISIHLPPFEVGAAVRLHMRRYFHINAELQPATPISTLDGDGHALQLRMAAVLRQMTTNHSFGVHGVYSGWSTPCLILVICDDKHTLYSSSHRYTHAHLLLQVGRYTFLTNPVRKLPSLGLEKRTQKS